MAAGFGATQSWFANPDWIKRLGLLEVTFTNVNLPIKDRSGTDMKAPFHLWGLTLNFVNELFFR